MMIQSLAATSAIAATGVAFSTGSAAATSTSPVSQELLDLIDAHKHAWDALGDTIDASDRMSGKYTGEEGERINRLAIHYEEACLAAIVLFPSKGPADDRAKGVYFSDMPAEFHGYEDAILDQLLANTATPAVPSAQAARVGADAYLVALMAEFHRATAAADEAWSVAQPTTAETLKIFSGQGLNLDRDLDKFSELMRLSGAQALEDRADALSDRLVHLGEEIEATRPKTIAGLAAKFELLRHYMRIEDAGRREDQDVEVAFFNVFADDLKALSP